MTRPPASGIHLPDAAPAAALDATLARFVTALAHTRALLDAFETELLEALPARSLRPREWQNIDRIGQRMDDIARGLTHLSATLPSATVPQTPLAAAFTLEELRVVFAPADELPPHTPSADPPPSSGGATLF